MDFSSPGLEATHSRLAGRFGAWVEPWWRQLPQVIEVLAARWDLVVGAPVGRGNTSLVVRCRRADGRAAVLKLCPDPAIADAETQALRAWESSGRVPCVWEYDTKLGALLLEAIPYETLVSELRSLVALSDVTDLIRALHRSGSPTDVAGVVSLLDRVEFVFDHWADRTRRNAAVVRAVPVVRLERGRALASALAADDGAGVLLHGDLHPGNVLDGGETRGLVAIDPRPCVGDPSFDAVDWVFWQTKDPDAWKPRSLELASSLRSDAERLWDWCVAFAPMLAAATAASGGSTDRVEALLALAQ